MRIGWDLWLVVFFLVFSGREWIGWKHKETDWRHVADDEIVAGERRIWAIFGILLAVAMLSGIRARTVVVLWHAVTCCDSGRGREQGRVPANVLLNSRLERAHRRSDPPLGDAVSTGCTGKAIVDIIKDNGMIPGIKVDKGYNKNLGFAGHFLNFPIGQHKVGNLLGNTIGVPFGNDLLDLVDFP